MTSPARTLLQRLDDVRANGKGWVAVCPNPIHNRRLRSLYVTEADDGRVLMKCFRCHDTNGILGAIGMDMRDLFPARLSDPSPESRRKAREYARMQQFMGAIRAIAEEALIVIVAASRIRQGIGLKDFDFERLHRAESLIFQSRQALMQ
jgi:hypothetical protein